MSQSWMAPTNNKTPIANLSQVPNERAYIYSMPGDGPVVPVAGWRCACRCLAKLPVLHSLFVLEITHMHICRATYTYNINICFPPTKEVTVLLKLAIDATCYLFHSRSHVICILCLHYNSGSTSIEI